MARFRHSCSLLVLLLCLLVHPLAALGGSDPSLDWKTVEASHFAIHYYQGERQLALEFLAIAEEAHDKLADFFGFVPSQNIHLVVTDDVDTANGLASVLPYNYVVLYAYVPDSEGELGFWLDWKRILVYHELTHIFQMEHVRGLLKWLNTVLGKTFLPNATMPTWLLEGLAVVVESRIGAGGRIYSPLYEMYLRVHALESRLLSIDEITGSPLVLPRGTVPYLYGGYFLRWVTDMSGLQAMADFVKEQAWKVNPYSINISARRNFSGTFVDLYEKWQAHTRARFKEQAAQLDREGLREGTALGPPGEGKPHPSFSPDGSLLFRLASGHDTAALMRLTPDGKTEKLHHCRGGCQRPQQTASGLIYYGSTQVYRTYSYYDELMVLDPESNKRTQLTDGARMKQPAISPDGRKVAFVRVERGESRLLVAPLNSLPTTHTLLEFKGSLGWPAWSPDGNTLALVQHDHRGANIVTVDIETRKTTTMTATTSASLHPVWHPTRNVLLFSSADSGIYNIYALCIEDRCLTRLTNVLGGAFSPTVSPDGKTVVYASYHHDGYRMHAVPFVIDGCDGNLADNISQALSVPVDISGVALLPEREYNPFKHAWPRSWRPRSIMDSYQTRIYGLDLLAHDPVRMLAWSAQAVVNANNWDSAATLSLSIDPWYPSIGLFLGYYKNTLMAFVDDEYRDYLEDDWFAQGSISFPFPGTDRSFSAYMGYSFEHFTGEIDGDWHFEPDNYQPWIPLEGNLSTLFAGFAFDNTETFAWSIAKEKGIRATSELRWSTPLAGSNWTEYHVKWGLTSHTPMPWFEHHVLRLLLKGGWAGGRRTFMKTFTVGGYPDRDFLTDLVNGTGVSGTYFRGYPPRAVRGHQYHMLVADYFFPVWRIRRGIQTFPVFFKDLYVDVFGNGAGAFDEFNWQDFCWGAGAEARLTARIGYHTSMKFILGAAYGFQEPGDFSVYFLLAP